MYQKVTTPPAAIGTSCGNFLWKRLTLAFAILLLAQVIYEVGLSVAAVNF